MARLIERSFDPSKPVYARRFFVAAGRHFKIGDAFPWQQLSVSQRKAKLLFDAGKLKHMDDEPAPRKAAAPAAKPAPEPAPEPSVQEEPPVRASDPGTDSALAEHATETEPHDDLSELGMKALRRIAQEEGAPTRLSRTEQRKAIREHRAGTAE